ncbi:hypothetical protein OGAPHI_005938 [Ogataea philodendri]|uniref:Uncharacterized protein n=1 Tax=Ogataea philodendri TaxID=1378263 RepID=A0A9P8T1B2_9ASCO|nr:uncharacterized protein OGAPHI_005938 [Ogataea philodendri]KAH3661760.1 hypothetical protein OGAPHI_005938 [Ogataea philodendri]
MITSFPVKNLRCSGVKLQMFKVLIGEKLNGGVIVNFGSNGSTVGAIGMREKVMTFSNTKSALGNQTVLAASLVISPPIIERMLSMTSEYELIQCSSRSNANKLSMLANFSKLDSFPEPKPNEQMLMNTEFRISE